MITFASAPGSITIDNHVLGGREWGVDEIHFANGTVWNAATILAEYAARQGSAAGELIGGSNEADTLNGQGGDDTIKAFSGNDTLIGGTGNDYMEGADGSDTYLYASGDGDDVIFDRFGTRDNHILFGAGITSADIILSRMVEDFDRPADHLPQPVRLDHHRPRDLVRRRRRISRLRRRRLAQRCRARRADRPGHQRRRRHRRHRRRRSDLRPRRQ